MFWKGYYWDGGVNYKHRLKRLKNGQLRVRGGVTAGADQTDFFFGAEVGFESTMCLSQLLEILCDSEKQL